MSGIRYEIKIRLNTQSDSVFFRNICHEVAEIFNDLLHVRQVIDLIRFLITICMRAGPKTSSRCKWYRSSYCE
jgi:hypothetical protein